ncbi:hypothetical protein [Aneurinibacillus tyrosinisolvens]|uniref:hypothetical protein n=1 Tax=Aneurinibacillus tyrosinisolvens TaxID=1443435 RepID=UPI00063F21AC|nr:hypothetical protein [Aneurinibacillus tyrosinisolvens]
MKIRYSKEKQDAIIEYTVEEFRDFTMKIPVSKLMVITKRLPQEKGFRPGKDTVLRLIKFFKRVKRWTEKDWELMIDIWVVWTESNPVFQQTLNLYSKDKLEKFIQEMINKPEIRYKATEKLIQAGKIEIVSEEMLYDWYKFGPFPTDEEVINLIRSAGLQEDYALQPRVGKIENKVGQLEVVYQNLDIQYKSLYTNLDINTKVVTEIKEFKIQLESKSVQNQEIIERINHLENTIDILNKNYNIALHQLDLLRDKLLESENKINLINGEVQTIKKSNTSWDEKHSQLEDLSGSVNKSILDLEEKISNLQQNSGKNIEEKLQENSTKQSTNLPSRGDNQIFEVLPISSQYRPDSIPLGNLKQTITHLEKNLNGLGIKLSDARNLSTEIFSALASGQLVTFDGSLAFIVAERCALSLAGEGVHLIRIPIGLTDTLSLELELKKYIETCSDSTVAIILEGINRSSLETYGFFIRQLIIERLFHKQDNGLSLLLFATIAGGPTAIPYGKEVLELGPVFHTDVLGWMNKSASKEMPGSIQNDVWLQVTELSDIEVDWEEISIPDWLLREGGAFWRRTLMMACTLGMELESSSNYPIQKLVLFGWVLPMALQIGGDRIKEIIDINIDDDRTKGLLHFNNPEMVEI